MSFLLEIENIAKSSKILISAEPFFSRSKDRSRTQDQKAFNGVGVKRLLRKRPLRKKFRGKRPQQIRRPHINFM